MNDKINISFNINCNLQSLIGALKPFKNYTLFRNPLVGLNSFLSRLDPMLSPVNEFDKIEQCV